MSRKRKPRVLIVDGKVYVPADILGPETVVILCASYDGVGLVSDDGGGFVPIDWAKREYPKFADVLTKIEDKALMEAAG